MPRPKRADEAGAIYHALNRGDARRTIFHKAGDYEAFGRIMSEGLDRYPIQLLAYQLMPSHFHLVLSPTEDGGMSEFTRWVTATHTMRYHAHHGTSGEGHIYQGRFRVSLCRTTITFLSCVAMLSATRFGLGGSRGQRTGGGDRYGVGFRRANRNQSCCPRGRSADYRTGSIE